MTERFGVSAVSLVGNILLAAMLMPDDFGLLAMLAIFTSMTYALVDCGMSDALLREPDATYRDFSTMFWFNVAVGVVIAVLFAALSPLVAQFFGRAELQPIMSVLGIGAVFSALAITPMTRLRSRLRFGLLAIVGISAIVLALTLALLIAWYGGGYWALVEMQVGYAFFYWLMVTIAARWWPQWQFDWQRFAQFWRFGANLLLSAIVVHVSNNIVAALLGRFYNATQAGYMGQAQKLQQAPVSALEAGISNATYASVARVDTPQAQDTAYLRYYRLFTLLLLLGCSLGIALAPVIVGWLFPERWLPTVPYLLLLLVWAMVYPLGGFMQVMLKLRGRTHVVAGIIVAERIAVIVSALVLWRYGVAVMLLAFTAISATAMACYWWQVSRCSTLTLRRLALIYLQGFAIAAIIGLPLWWLIVQ